MQLIIAEKPSVARDLARVLGVRPSGKGCFEGARCVITWCVGHLVELEEPSAYDPAWRAWRLELLPMLPEELRLRPAKHARDQLRAVTGLLRDRRFTSVVNACDAGREGELIFRYVYQHAGAKLPVQRLWISSLTDDAIRRGFEGLRPGARFDALGDAARCRSEADWLVGMNATRAITVRGRQAGHDALYSIGRVQTPTLAMLVERERAIRAFVPRPYWEVRGEFRTASGERFSAMWRAPDVVVPDREPEGELRRPGPPPPPPRAHRPGRLATRELATTLVGRDATSNPGPIVERVTAKTVREPPPLLFDLTSLQRTANRRFGFSAARTLELAQALYERHKILTYPRTDSRFLTSDVVGELHGLFESLAAVPDYAAFAGELIANPPRPNRRVVDDSKVHDHHAIIPTGTTIRLDALDRDERRLFDLVARRFLGAFFPDAEFATTEVAILVAGKDVRVDPSDQVRKDPRVDRAPVPSGGPIDGVIGKDSRVGHAPGGKVRSDGAENEPTILEHLPAMPDRYLARGRVRMVAGWQEVAGIDGAHDPQNAERGPDAEPVATLPRLVEGQSLAGAYVPLEKQTTPPPRFSEATLLGAMESAGKAIDDEALRAAMKDRGLGTPATRAAIIETLLRRGYIDRAAKNLVPTEMGIALILALPVASLASAELTGTWEARLSRVARGEESRAAFMADIARYVRDTVDAIRGASPPSPPPGGAPAQQWSRNGKHRTRGGGSSGSGRRRGSNTAPRTSRTNGSRTAARAPTPKGSRSSMSANPMSNGSRSAPANPMSNARPMPSTSAARPSPNGRATASHARPSGGPASSRHEPAANAPSILPMAAARTPNDAAFLSTMAEHVARMSTSTLAERPMPNGTIAVAEIAERSMTNSPARVSGSPRAAADASARAAQPRSASGARELRCPRCSDGTLITGSRGWGCSQWREGCRFVVWFEMAGRRLTEAQLRDLVTRGKTRKASFGERSGRLVLEADRDDGAARFEPA